jgi:hypothetical protein
MRLEDLDVDGRIILEYVRESELNSYASRQWTFSFSKKCGFFLLDERSPASQETTLLHGVFSRLFVSCSLESLTQVNVSLRFFIKMGSSYGAFVEWNYIKYQQELDCYE